MRAYQGDTFFWGLAPQPGDTITFNFEVSRSPDIRLCCGIVLTRYFILFQPPILLSTFKFVSGNAEHPSDRFINTTCEVLLDDPKKAVTLSKLPQLKDGFFIVGGFDNFGVAEGTIGQDVGKIKQFRLNIHSTGENWAILSEINLKKVT